MIVADAGPIIAFACIGRLALLWQAVGALIVLEVVYEEPVVKGGDRPRAEEVRRGGGMHGTPCAIGKRWRSTGRLTASGVSGACDSSICEV